MVDKNGGREAAVDGEAGVYVERTQIEAEVELFRFYECSVNARLQAVTEVCKALPVRKAKLTGCSFIEASKPSSFIRTRV